MNTKVATIPTLSALYKAGKLGLASNASPEFPPSRSFNDRVALWRGDITKLEIDAIVNAANQSLLGGGGVDGAIHRAAGRSLLNECQTLGGCRTGEAKVTSAYKLPCDKVIHTVGPVYRQYGKEEASTLLANCYRNSLEVAVREGCQTIAFCAISTGIYGYPSRDAARVATSTVRQFLSGPNGDNIRLVLFVNFEMKDVVSYEEHLPLVFPPAPEAGVE